MLLFSRIFPSLIRDSHSGSLSPLCGSGIIMCPHISSSPLSDSRPLPGSHFAWSHCAFFPLQVHNFLSFPFIGPARPIPSVFLCWHSRICWAFQSCSSFPRRPCTFRLLHSFPPPGYGTPTVFQSPLIGLGGFFFLWTSTSQAV